MSDALPLAGRRFYFVGIGGSGLSAYANIARAWGAEVRGWDVRDTIFMKTLTGIEVDLGGDPLAPDGWEVILSSAHTHRLAGTPRAAFLAELVALRPSIVVAGAHGKTTTAGMVAFVLRETGRDPSWIVGGVIPQLGGNAGVGDGWLVVEGDESDRSLFTLRPRVAGVTNIELDHHATYASEDELRTAIEEWLEAVPDVVRAWELEPYDGNLAVPGEHNRSNAALALALLDYVGVPREEAVDALARFSGAERRFELVGERGSVVVYDDYGHNPTELRVTLATARACVPVGGRLVAIYQPHVFERTRRLWRELGAALGGADVAIVTEVTGARDAPREGTTGRWVLNAVPSGVSRLWAPVLDDATTLALSVVRPGDVVVTFGVGEPWRVARAIVAGLPG
jgi:UDP-N-acetylmuramate--alanine ligase